MKPLLAEHIPARRQHNNTPIRECSEIVLHPPAAESVLNTMFLSFTGEGGFRDVIRALLGAQAEFRAAQHDPAAPEVALHTRSSSRLQHLAVPRPGPFPVDVVVTTGTYG